MNKDGKIKRSIFLVILLRALRADLHSRGVFAISWAIVKYPCTALQLVLLALLGDNANTGTLRFRKFQNQQGILMLLFTFPH